MVAPLTMENGAFGYESHPVFSKLSLEVAAGEVLCILGANGCGKTTLLRCLSGALRLQAGCVRLGGRDVKDMAPGQIARAMGIVFQEHNAPFPFTVLEVVAMGRAPHLGFLGTLSAHDRQIAADALAMVGIQHLRDQAYTRISGGERQMVLIARCLAQEPKILLFDEPTSHLDYKNQALVLGIVQQLARRGLAVAMTTHMPDHALMFPSQVALMSAGQFIAVGEAAEVITEENLEATYGIQVRVLAAADGRDGRSHRFCVPVLAEG